MQPDFLRKSAWVGVAMSAALLTCVSPTQARVIRIVIDQTLNQPAIGGVQTVAYQTLNGRAFGELCIANWSVPRTTRSSPTSIWHRRSRARAL